MKVENEAQAVSLAREMLKAHPVDLNETVSRWRNLARWILDDYEKRTRAAKSVTPRKHIVVICDHYWQMSDWSLELRIRNESVRYLHAQTPETNPNRWRGLAEGRIAFVRLSPRAFTETECRVFGPYQALGAKEFLPTDRVLIRSWIGVVTPLHDD